MLQVIGFLKEHLRLHQRQGLQIPGVYGLFLVGYLQEPLIDLFELPVVQGIAQLAPSDGAVRRDPNGPTGRSPSRARPHRGG